MDELQNELHRHYGLLLGIKSPWEVHGVNLDMAGRRVEIRLECGNGVWKRGGNGKRGQLLNIDRPVARA
jgi:hypothetical protein